MKTIFLFIAVLSILFFSCDPKLDRDEFIGNYAGTTTSKAYLNGELTGQTSDVANMEITAGINDDEIIIDGEIGASVISTTYTVLGGESYYMDLDDGSAVKFSISGTGQLTSNGSIVQSWTMTTLKDGKTIEIKTSGTLERID